MMVAMDMIMIGATVDMVEMVVTMVVTMVGMEMMMETRSQI